MIIIGYSIFFSSWYMTLLTDKNTAGTTNNYGFLRTNNAINNQELTSWNENEDRSLQAENKNRYQLEWKNCMLNTGTA